jgi:hypothetical protein
VAVGGVGTDQVRKAGGREAREADGGCLISLCPQSEWLLETTLSLPWRPFISVIGVTIYTLNEDSNQVCECGWAGRGRGRGKRVGDVRMRLCARRADVFLRLRASS